MAQEYGEYWGEDGQQHRFEMSKVKDDVQSDPKQYDGIYYNLGITDSEAGIGIIEEIKISAGKAYFRVYENVVEKEPSYDKKTISVISSGKVKISSTKSFQDTGCPKEEGRFVEVEVITNKKQKKKIKGILFGNVFYQKR